MVRSPIPAARSTLGVGGTTRTIAARTRLASATRTQGGVRARRRSSSPAARSRLGGGRTTRTIAARTRLASAARTQVGVRARRTNTVATTTATWAPETAVT